MFTSSPTVETIHSIVEIFGWPALLTGFVWLVRTFDKGQRELRDIHDGTKLAVTTVAEVKNAVDTMQTNHLAHLQDGIESLAKSNDKAVELLVSVDRNIAILADRSTRA